MYSSQGLSNWELVVVSGLLALSILVISAMLGSAVAFIALREPKPVAERIRVKEKRAQAERSSQSVSTIPQSA